MKFDTLRFLIAHVTRRDLELCQVDVKTAFLYGELTENIFMLPSLTSEVHSSITNRMKDSRCGDRKLLLKRLCSEPVQGSSDFVLSLNKSLYGLKQASKQWNNRLKSVLASCGFVQSTYNPCFYVASIDDRSTCYVVFHVYNLVIDGKSKDLCLNVEKTLGGLFDSSVMDVALFFLGLLKIRDRKKNKFWIYQRAYIDRLLPCFKFDKSAKDVPIRNEHFLQKATSK